MEPITESIIPQQIDIPSHATKCQCASPNTTTQ